MKRNALHANGPAKPQNRKPSVCGPSVHHAVSIKRTWHAWTNPYVIDLNSLPRFSNLHYPNCNGARQFGLASIVIISYIYS